MVHIVHKKHRTLFLTAFARLLKIDKNVLLISITNKLQLHALWAADTSYKRKSQIEIA